MSCPRFFIVDTYPLIRQNSLTASSLRKQPPIFCWSLIILRSRSAWLLSKGTRNSLMNLNISSCLTFNLITRLLPCLSAAVSDSTASPALHCFGPARLARNRFSSHPCLTSPSYLSWYCFSCCFVSRFLPPAFAC